MRTTIALAALVLIAAQAKAQQFTDAQGTTYQLQTVQVCNGNGTCHLESRWVSVATSPVALTPPVAKPMPATPAQTAEPPLAVGYEATPAAFPLAKAFVGNHPLIHRLFHPFNRVRARLFGAGGNCGCGGACGAAGC